MVMVALVQQETCLQMPAQEFTSKTVHGEKGISQLWSFQTFALLENSIPTIAYVETQRNKLCGAALGEAFWMMGCPAG